MACYTTHRNPIKRPETTQIIQTQRKLDLICPCLACKKVNSPLVQSSILKPVKIVDKLLPFLHQLNNQNLEQSIIEYDQARCSKLKSNLAINLISKSFGVCLDKETFSFQDENILF